MLTEDQDDILNKHLSGEFDVANMGPNLDTTLKSPIPQPKPIFGGGDTGGHGASGSWDAPAPAPMPVPPARNPSAIAPKVKSENPDVASSHPGFDQDALDKYLADQKGQMDKFGADHMADSMKNMHDQENGVVSSIGRRMAGASDAIMQGVARAGNPGNLRAYDERQARNVDENDKQLGALNATNMADTKAKAALDQQSSHNAMGASIANAILPTLKALYPGKTDAQYAEMARNPAVAEALLPESVKLKEGEDRIKASHEDRLAAREMARERMDHGFDKDYMTRLEKDSSGFNKDANVVKSQGTLDKLGAAKGLLESGNVNNATAKQALQTALTFVATGGQRVNETEMKQLGGAHTVANRINQWMKGLNDGTLTPKDYSDMKQVIGIYENAANTNLAEARQRFATQRAQREGIDPKKAFQELGGTDAPAGGGQPPEITDQAGYNALPSGASYMANGVLHRKK